MSVRITRWEPKQLKEQLTADLMANSEIAGKFVETDARRRLMAIKDPEWGKNYRQKLVARLLTFIVEKSGNDVVTSVGVEESSSSEWHGFYIELGSKKAPAHPFLRPAVFDNARKILALLCGQ